MALADMYKVNNVTYYGSGHGMSGVFTDTIENLTANGMIDYSIFLNTGSTWSMKNTGTIGNHFAWYADWVSGVLAVRKGPDVIPITYLGSAILSKNTGCTIANLSAKQADGAGWADFKNARFMIDAINATPGSATQYVPFNYAAYSGQKYGFNSCFIQSTAGYATSNTAYNYTFINDYTALTGDNAKRIVYSSYIVMLTIYNPYLTDNTDIDKQDIGYIWDFFDIGGEIVCVRDILRMPNSAHWQSWAYYHDVTDKYITIGGFGGNIVAGTQGALPESDNVKGIFSYNHNGTSANWFTTKNAVDYKINSMGLRWCVGDTTISTAKQWRDNVRLGVMRSDGVIKHNEWIIGESAIQASDNPNKNTDYDHIPAHGGGGADNPWDVDPETYGWSGGEVSGMVKYYLLTSGEMSQLQTAIASNANWTIDYLNCIVSCFVVPNSGIFFDAPIPTTVKFVLDNATQWDTGVSCKRIQGTKYKNGGTIEIPRLTKTFYDFEPYSDYSVYIPFCGRVPIKGNVCLGREIKVTYYPDVPTCSLTAVISCDGATIAIAKGSFGTMTPVTSNGSDRKTAAVIGDVAPIITGIGTGIVGVALGNPLIVGAGAAQALGGIMGGVKETVQSYAYSVGSTGDSSFFGAGNRCYYYANYPIIDDVVNNSMFGHSVGYLCNTVGKLSSFTGFTICANPHVTFSATAEEREEIERLLSMGVIL